MYSTKWCQNQWVLGTNRVKINQIRLRHENRYFWLFSDFLIAKIITILLIILAILTNFFPSRVTSIKNTDKIVEIVTYQKMDLPKSIFANLKICISDSCCKTKMFFWALSLFFYCRCLLTKCIFSKLMSFQFNLGHLVCK